MTEVCKPLYFKLAALFFVLCGLVSVYLMWDLRDYSHELVSGPCAVCEEKIPGMQCVDIGAPARYAGYEDVLKKGMRSLS